jgi:hypothetical protein
VSAARVRVAALAALVLTFAAGLAVGWGVGRHPGPGGHGPRRGPPPPTRETFDRLRLTPTQRASVDSIFAARRAQIDMFWEGPGSRLRFILDSTAIDVRSVLDSAQRATFDAMQREGGRGGPPPPGGRPPDGPPPDGPPRDGPPGGRPPAPPPRP